VAFAGQTILEDIVVNAWRAALELTNQPNLVYAGGVALNSVANEKAYRAVKPKQYYIPPNPGDPGHALGCLLFGAYELADWPRPQHEMTEYLGPTYSFDEIEMVIKRCDFPTIRCHDLESRIAHCIANGHITARFDGGAEFGPRALGNRSILCDPRRAGMKDYLNSRVKHREAFRPFAPSVLEEYASAWFDMKECSPYMLRVIPILENRLSEVPAIAHVDDTARVQTVSREQNPGYWQLIQAFNELTGVPLVLNTSFNIAGKPIVETPQDAMDCFVSTEIDVMVLGPFIVSKRPLEEYIHNTSGV
jgi:carbamoyltransferase